MHMLRKLLALVVLVTGLAALGQPAQALSLEVGSVRAAADAGYACTVQSAATISQRGPRTEREDTQPKICPKPPRIVLVVPTVMLQADRARE
jgi:hypothetical protein